MMKRALLGALLFLLVPGQVLADQLADIKSAGKITVGVFDSNPPFGYIDEKTHAVVGYDVDFAQELAKRLGVKVELKTTNPANRIPLLVSAKVNMMVAAFTITDERAKLIDFSYPYFVTGQQFLVPKGKYGKKEDLTNAKIGATKGTTGEAQARAAFPKARIISYDEMSLSFAAQRNGNVQVITQDGAVLASLLASTPDRDKYEIPSYRLSEEFYGIALKKGETALVQQINRLLLDMEKDGTAAKIHEKWFGKTSKAPMNRDFKIVAK